MPILPEDSLRAAWAGLAASSAAVRRSELRDLLERHQLDQEEVCDSPCAPPTVAELETALRAAGAALPNIEEFRDPRDPGSASTAYRFELISRTGALLDGLRETGIDQLLVWLPLLEFAARPVGTGPYRYGAREPATSLELVVNEDYFDGRPLIPRIQLYPMPTHPNSRPAIPVDLVLGGTEGDPRYAIDLPRWSQQSQFSWFLFAFNLRPGSLFVDQRLRQAFALCFDRRDLVSQWVHDGIPTDSFVHPSSWAHDETRLPARDVGRGRQLIEEAGWVPGERGVYEKDGRRLAMDLALNAGRVERVVLAKAAAVQLQDCGMELSVLEADYFFNPVFGLPGTSDVDLIGLPMGFDPDGFDFLHSTRKYDLERVDAGQDLNIPAWSNPEADRLLEEGRTEVDPASRLEIYLRLQEILRDELPYLPLFVRTHPFGLAAHVRAIDGTIDLESPRYAWNIEDWVVEP